jgi:hypothetical protein
MSKFKEIISEKLVHLLREAGEEAGGLEVAKINAETAEKWARKECEKHGEDFDKIFPDFEEHFNVAKSKALTGKTQRKDMPVIDEKDVKMFQTRLARGHIDFKAPYAKETKDAQNPFPDGLDKKTGDQWLKNGLKDGENEDDKVSVKTGSMKAKDLKPIQKQIYLDKSIGSTIKFGLPGTVNFLKNKSTLVCSSDRFIIDGHHRWMSAIFIDPDMPLNMMIIDLPISKLLPLSLSYSDAVGNERNK